MTSNIPGRRRPRRRPAAAAAGMARRQNEPTRAVRISPGRIGRWSARHPWLALAIWGAFVAGCLAAGAAAGTKTLSNGLVRESARGNAVLSQYGLAPAREYVYLHGSGLASTDPGFAAAVEDVAHSIRALGLQATEATSADRHSVLVSAAPGRPISPAAAGELSAAPARIQAVLAGVRRAHPGLAAGETGDISASDAQNQIVNGNLSRVELLAHPGHLAGVGAGVRLAGRRAGAAAARPDRGRGRAGPARPDQPPLPRPRQRQGDHPADRPGGRG